MLTIKNTVASAVAVATLASGALLVGAPAASAEDTSGATGVTGVTGVSGLPSRNLITPEKRAALRMRAASRTVATARTMRIKTQKQQYNWWCVPASSRAALTALGRYSNPPTQHSLAKAMKTSKAKYGTSVSDMIRVVNKLQKRNYYAYSGNLTLTAYRYRVETGLSVYGAPNLLDVQMSRLPWYRGTGVSGQHEVVNYGYNRTSSHFTMSAFDPWDNKRHRGSASSALYKASLSKDIAW